MAETVVNLVLHKLADTIIQEAFFLYGVHDKVRWVQRELTWIQSFLKDADSKCHKDERVKHWVNEVKEVSFLIEDLIDNLLMDIDGMKQDGLHNTLKRIGKMPMKLIAKHKLGTNIDKIQQRIWEISENTKKYGIEGLGDNTSTIASSNQPIKPLVIPDIDETEVIGFEADKKNITDQLIDTNIIRRSVISIVGAGGSGKTTLAKEVYKSPEVRCHFGIHMWLTISQDFKLSDILMKLLEEIIEVGTERRKIGEEYLITMLNKCMREKKYLVVLDDVWRSNVWTQLAAVLPNANNGSRVLITTRFLNIAEEADTISKPYKIKTLNEEDSKQLLLKKVFPNQFANECPEDVLPLVTQFTRKCGGWPLALVVVGGILSRKYPDYNTWDEVRKMDWHIDGSQCMGVISTSYEYLPVKLKPCFMYFVVFPEDYQIKATNLIQLWIAEGFIPDEGTKSMEDIAESYLEELVQRCMVQVSSRSCIGKIKYCHIHDLLRDLAIQRAKENNFLMVFSKDTKMSSITCARRVALHLYGNDTIFKHAQRNLRSLIYFGAVPNCNRFRMLRVLHISRAKYSSLPSIRCLEGLSALKYLVFEGKFGSCLHLPNVGFLKVSPLTCMKNLQTVRTWVCKNQGKFLPSFWDNKLLRHVILSCCRFCEAAPDGPPSTAHLPSLQTLKGVKARPGWNVELPKFPQIQKLGIYVPEDVAWEPLINLLSNQNDLGSLHLETRGDNPITFPCCISAFKNQKRLHSLKLVRGKWSTKVDWILFPPHLMKLTLSYFSFVEDPMPQLEKLPNLKILRLSYSIIEVADVKQIVCSRGGFGRLQQLMIYVDNLEEWKIEEGSMPMLNQLVLARCRRLHTVPDLQYLTNLQELTVASLDQCNLRLRGQDQWKIKHIPSVITLQLR